MFECVCVWSDPISFEGPVPRIPVAVCDKTGVVLIPGSGWYHNAQKGEDVSRLALGSFTPSDREPFKEVLRSEDLGDGIAAERYYVMLPQALNLAERIGFTEVWCPPNPRPATTASPYHHHTDTSALLISRTGDTNTHARAHTQSSPPSPFPPQGRGGW